MSRPQWHTSNAMPRLRCQGLNGVERRRGLLPRKLTSVGRREPPIIGGSLRPTEVDSGQSRTGLVHDSLMAGSAQTFWSERSQGHSWAARQVRDRNANDPREGCARLRCAPRPPGAHSEKAFDARRRRAERRRFFASLRVSECAVL